MAKAIFGDYSIIVEKHENSINSSIKVFFKDNLLYAVEDFNEEDVQALISVMMTRKSRNPHGLFPILPDTNIYTKYATMTGDSLWSVSIIDSAKDAASIRSMLAGGGDAPIKYHNNVFIALPQESIPLDVIENIQNACGELMEALGYELEIAEEPVLGSFYQKLKFILTSPKTKREVAEGFSKAKAALEFNYLNLPSAEATEKLSNAASNLITSLNGVDEGLVRLGALLVVKVTREGKVRILSETLSPELSLLLDKTPQILNNPNTIYELLQSMTNKNYFNEGDGVNVKHIES